MKDLKYGMLGELYGTLLPPRQREIIKNYYDFDLSLSEIADNCSITRQAAYDALRKGELALECYENEMGFYGRMAGIKSGLESAAALIAGNKPDEAAKLLEDIAATL